MPQASTITVTKHDGSTTIDLNPTQVSPDRSVFTSDVAATLQGETEAIIGVRRPNGSSNVGRVTVRFNIPVETVVDGVTKVAHTARFNGDLIIPSEMASADRDEFVAQLASLLGQSSVQSAIRDVVGFY